MVRSPWSPVLTYAYPRPFQLPDAGPRGFSAVFRPGGGQATGDTMQRLHARDGAEAAPSLGQIISNTMQRMHQRDALPATSPTTPAATVTPPVGGDVTPIGVVADNDLTELETILKRLGITGKDYMAEAEQRYGPPPTDPGGLTLSPWEIAAMGLPALLGGNAGLSAVLAAATGALGGHAARRDRYRENLGDYRNRVATMAEKMESSDEKRASLFLPWAMEKATDRRRNAATEARLQLDRDRLHQQRDLERAKQDLDRWKWANPSANATLTAQMRAIDAQIRENHNRAQEALAAGRLDEANRHNRAVEALTQQARDIGREQARVARGRLDLDIQKFKQTGSMDSTAANRTVSYYKSLVDDIRQLRGNLADVFKQYTPDQKEAMKAELDRKEDEEEELRPITRKLTGREGSAPNPTDTGMPRPGEVPKESPSSIATQVFAAWTKTKKPLPRKHWENLTRAEQEWLTAQGVQVEK